MSTDTTTVMEKKKIKYRTEDSGDTTTTTVMEKKKRAYKRKDCGDTTTLMKKKKRAYRRKDRGDKNTTMVMEKKKRAYKRKDRGDTNASTVMEKKKRECAGKDCGDTNTTREVFLPHDIILEEILTKLPVPTLLKSVLVSKLWYNSIHNDHKRLTYSHFLESRKQPDVILSLLNVRSAIDTKPGGDVYYACHFFKFTSGVFSNDRVLKFRKFQHSLTQRYIWELVGYCNGLPCVAQVGNYTSGYTILDPNRKDFLFISYPAGVGRRIPNPHIICHGFGFDPLANEYKLVSIMCTAQEELKFLVFTLGTKSWRNVTAKSTPVSGHGGRPIIKIRAPTGSDKSAIICTANSSGGSGFLVWKIVITLGGAGSNGTQLDNSNNDVNNEMEMLLSFNLHDEKFQFIQLPTKCTTDEQQKHLLSDYPHLLEFKGSPCIARIEKQSGNGSDHRRRRRCSSSCCCCCKVHLYVLKDKVKEAWVKEESFDVRINSNLDHRAPDPCCFCFRRTTTTPMRIFSFSNQMFLYWFNGVSLQVYNLRSGKLQIVLPIYLRENQIFRAKVKEPRHMFINSGDDDIYCSNVDYQLHCHEENFLSLQTFVPEGVAGVAAKVFYELDLKKEDTPCLAYVSINRGSRVCYLFYGQNA